MEKRLDVLLVKLGFFDSRSKAVLAIEKQLVKINGKTATKPSLSAKQTDTIEVEPLEFISRGGEKLHKALVEFGIETKNKTAVDIGAGTGGFTDALLKSGMKKVYCIDTGSNQLNPKIANDPRVENFEKTNYLNFTADFFKEAAVVVMDVSFVSCTKFSKKLVREFPTAEIIVLIKPQFECGVEYARKHKGIVRDKKIHLSVLHQVQAAFEKEGLFLNQLTYSPILGGNGNIEFLAKFSSFSKKSFVDKEKIIDLAHKIV